MHELSVAIGLVGLAERKAGQLEGARVEAVHVRLGALAGVAGEALRFAFDAASRGTRLEGARLVIEEVPVVVFCAGCQAERVLDEPLRFRCPACGARASDVLRGRELELTALEVRDAPSRPPRRSRGRPTTRPQGTESPASG